MNSERMMATTRKTLLAVLAATIAMLACMAFAPQALANQTMDAPITVSDDITRVHVSKLDADTHGYVEGATMAIIEKDTGTVVDEWVTGSAAHQTEKRLDVGKVYILREIAAPEGYDLVQDVEFMIDKTEGKPLKILSKGDDAELTESYKLNLYDKALPVVEEQVENRTRGTSDNISTERTTTRTVAPKTGDETPIWIVGVLIAIAAIAIVVLEVSKRRMKE